jgi:hypothetical protein
MRGVKEIEDHLPPDENAGVVAVSMKRSQPIEL